MASKAQAFISFDLVVVRYSDSSLPRAPTQHPDPPPPQTQPTTTTTSTPKPSAALVAPSNPPEV